MKGIYAVGDIIEGGIELTPVAVAAAGNFAAGFARVFGVGFLLGPAVAACAPFAAAACPAFRTFAAVRPSVFRRPLCNVNFPTIFHCIDESYSLYDVNYVNTVLMVYHS